MVCTSSDLGTLESCPNVLIPLYQGIGSPEWASDNSQLTVWQAVYQRQVRGEGVTVLS